MSVSELERQFNELTGALGLLFELREEFAQGQTAIEAAAECWSTDALFEPVTRNGSA